MNLLLLCDDSPWQSYLLVHVCATCRIRESFMEKAASFCAPLKALCHPKQSQQKTLDGLGQSSECPRRCFGLLQQVERCVLSIEQSVCQQVLCSSKSVRKTLSISSSTLRNAFYLFLIHFPTILCLIGEGPKNLLI